MTELQAYGEPVATGFDHVFRGRLLHRERTAFQLLEVYEHEHFGRMLMLDEVVQTTERDEFCYHEMLVHPALASLETVDRVLVIGGGDGGTLRRVLEHGPREAVLCEIDEAVTNAGRAWLPSVSGGALEDPRTTLVFDDGAAYVARESEAFDAIVVDSTDPVGPAVVLFSENFYAACRRALRPGGVLVAQSGSPMYQGAELRTAFANMSKVFASVELYTGFVPTYPGVLWSFTTGTDGRPVGEAPRAEIAARLGARGIRTRFYTPDLHAAAFRLPAFVGDLVRGAVASTASASVPRG